MLESCDSRNHAENSVMKPIDLNMSSSSVVVMRCRCLGWWCLGEDEGERRGLFRFSLFLFNYFLIQSFFYVLVQNLFIPQN